ncbi:MAG TPA: CbiX/SirB N-terminal domain-containing protein [Mycobacteriales bacterium]|nr:CbiX/SirB N-terminal domain-containing protein [Mycobacteriales bacterium]
MAHGTRSPAGVHTVCQIVDSVRTAASDADVRLAWIELVEPDVPAVLAELAPDRAAIMVPLLLSSGYHDRVDLPAAIAATRPGTAHGPVLGPDPLLAVALADRLTEAGWTPTAAPHHPASADGPLHQVVGGVGGDVVVLAAAGSSDADAVASVRVQAELLAAELAAGGGAPVRVTVGFGSAAAPTVAEAVATARADGADRVVIAPYLLAPGHFADRLADAGADLVAAPLGAHPAVVELILQRASTGG